jgi:hypothetical protein
MDSKYKRKKGGRVSAKKSTSDYKKTGSIRQGKNRTVSRSTVYKGNILDPSSITSKKTVSNKRTGKVKSKSTKHTWDKSGGGSSTIKKSVKTNGGTRSKTTTHKNGSTTTIKRRNGNVVSGKTRRR